MNISVTAIVLKVQTVSNSDRICTLLTDKLGIVRAFARGANNIKNKNFPATSQFVYGRYELFCSRDRYMIDEAVHERLFVPIRDDIERLALAQYMCELAIELVPSEMPAEEYLRFASFAFSHLANADRPIELVKAVYELRMLSLAGFLPDLVMCADCGAYEAEQMYFLPERSVIYCAECMAKVAAGAPMQQVSCVRLTKGAMYAMRHAVYAQLSKVFSFELAAEPLAQLARAAERYALVCVNRSFATLDFYKSMLPTHSQ